MRPKPKRNPGNGGLPADHQVVEARMPPRLRAAVSKATAGIAVAAKATAGIAVASALLMAAGAGSALADAGPSIHTVAIGGIAAPSTGPGASGGMNLPASELYGGSGSSGSSPGGGTPPVLYSGGPVMHAVTTQVVAWAPSGYPFPSGYVSGYEQYLFDMSTGLGLSSNISSIAAQYVDASGPALTSLANNAPIGDTDPYPSSGCAVSGTSVCLTEGQILTELSDVITANALSTDLSHSYIVLLPPSVDTCVDSSSSECEDQAFCGYHTAFMINDAYTTFTLLPYTESSYSNSGGQCYDPIGPSNVSSAVMALDSVGAHELVESATDPLVGSGYIDSTGNEVADECAWTWGTETAATGGGHYNQLVNGDQYMIQEMWSNQANNCELGVAGTAQASISASALPLTGTPTGFSAGLTGDSSAASSYEWSYMAPDGSVSSDVATGANPQITFSSTGTYTVWVQITDAAGGTITGVSDETVAAGSARPPSAGIGWSETNPTAGVSLNFSAGATAGAGSITAYSWSFGDGGTSPAPSPWHTYTNAGTYAVTLTVTQSDGLSSSVQRTIFVNPSSTGSTGSGSSSGSSGQEATGSGSTDVVPSNVVTSWLVQSIKTTGTAKTIGSLLHGNGIATTLIASPASGRVVLTWYATVKHHAVVIASGSWTSVVAVAPHVRIKLTRAGRALLARSRRVTVSVHTSFRSSVSSMVITTRRTLTLKR
jgi:PKD repeat protein